MIELNSNNYTSIHVSEGILANVEEAGYTYLHCTYYTSPKYTSDWWINIFSSCFLIDKRTKNSLKLIDAINIPIAPARHFLKNKGDCLNFTLVFPLVPNDWPVFNFMELTDTNDGLNIRNIPRNTSGVYKVIIS